MPAPPENRNWRIIQELQRGLTEQEARKILREASPDSRAYAESLQHEYIETYDGPITIGRPAPEGAWVTGTGRS